MIYYKKGECLNVLDHESGYFMPDDMGFASSLMYRNIASTEEPIIQWLNMRFECTNPGTFVDIGAHVGTYTIELAKVFSRVCAFEPCRHTYNILCGNVALRNLSDKCDLYNTALSDKEETVTYKGYDTLGGNNMCIREGDNMSHELSRMYSQWDSVATSTEIRTKTLDSYGLDDVSLIKVDVEGFELNVLKGASETIARCSYPLILVESWEAQETDDMTVRLAKSRLRNDLFGYLHEVLGYTVENLYNDVFMCYR